MFKKREDYFNDDSTTHFITQWKRFYLWIQELRWIPWNKYKILFSNCEQLHCFIEAQEPEVYFHSNYNVGNKCNRATFYVLTNLSDVKITINRSSPESNSVIQQYPAQSWLTNISWTSYHDLDVKYSTTQSHSRLELTKLRSFSGFFPCHFPQPDST